jgi:DNA primase
MKQWVNFGQVKQAVPLMKVLEGYRLQGFRRSGKDQWRGCCPLHGGQGQDSFHVNTARQLFHCFSCEAGGTVLDFVAAMEKCTLAEAARKLATEWKVGEQSQPAAVAATVTEKRKSNEPLRFRLRGVEEQHPYLKARRITEQTARTFGVGFYAGPGLMNGRLVIPIHDERGHLIAYSGRSVDGSQPRYKFPAGFAKSQVLFNLHRAAALARQTVIVVEGFFDCLQVHQAGFGSVVALMGVGLYERQEWLLKKQFGRVILMLDGDEAGRQASVRIAGQLRANCVVEIVELVDNQQPDQLTAEEIQKHLRERMAPPSDRSGILGAAVERGNPVDGWRPGGVA